MVTNLQIINSLESAYKLSAGYSNRRWSVLFVSVNRDYLSEACYLYSKYVLKDYEPKLTHCVFFDGVYAYDPTTSGVFVTEHADITELMLDYDRDYIQSITYTPTPEASNLTDSRIIETDRLRLRDFLAFGVGLNTGMLCTSWLQYVTGVNPKVVTKSDAINRQNFMTPSELHMFMLVNCREPTRLIKSSGRVFKISGLY